MLLFLSANGLLLMKAPDILHHCQDIATLYDGDCGEPDYPHNADFDRAMVILLRQQCNPSMHPWSTNLCPRPGEGSGGDFTLMCSKRIQDLLLFALRHFEVIECVGKLRRHLVEHFGRDV
jgi:hypothetical protein